MRIITKGASVISLILCCEDESKNTKGDVVPFVGCIVLYFAIPIEDLALWLCNLPLNGWFRVVIEV